MLTRSLKTLNTTIKPTPPPCTFITDALRLDFDAKWSTNRSRKWSQHNTLEKPEFVSEVAIHCRNMIHAAQVALRTLSDHIFRNQLASLAVWRNIKSNFARGLHLHTRNSFQQVNPDELVQPVWQYLDVLSL